MSRKDGARVRVTVVGVGGAGGNAIQRMADSKLPGLDLLAVNTDAQALGRLKKLPAFAIGPATTDGMGSGGDADVGRKAIKESQEQVSQLLEGTDMVFITAGMGGGTGTGAAPVIAEIARTQGALTIGVVTRPFSFEGNLRREVADRGLEQMRQKVDTLITIDNDRLISSLDGKLSLDRAFRQADEVLRHGVEGISEILLVPGLINVDFADVKSVMGHGGSSFMAMGEGKGSTAAADAVDAALSNPLFDAPLLGARGILFNIKAGKELALGEVNEVAGVIRDTSRSQAQVIFGVVQDRRWKDRVSITLVATGVGEEEPEKEEEEPDPTVDEFRYFQPHNPTIKPITNGHSVPASWPAR